MRVDDDRAIVKKNKKKGLAGVDNTSRRTWDKKEFAEKAAEREKVPAPIPPQAACCVPLRLVHPAGT